MVGMKRLREFSSGFVNDGGVLRIGDGGGTI
jgi:hypothetical protein